MRRTSLLGLVLLMACSAARGAAAADDDEDWVFSARNEDFIVRAFRDPKVMKALEEGARTGQTVVVEDELGFESAEAATSAEAEEPHRYIGVMGDVGLPDAVGASLVVSPWYWLRLHAGVTTDLSGIGIRGGVTIAPIRYWVAPTATVEYGHMWDGDVNWIGRLITQDRDKEYASLRRVTYDYVNGHLGLEFGSPNRIVFFIRAGVSYIHAEPKLLEEDINELSGQEGLTAKHPVMRYIGPSGKIGLLVFF